MLAGSGIEVLSAADLAHVSEPEETGATFEENAALKAMYYATATGLPALADDSGLVVDALGGRPGVQSARYGNDDAERIERLLSEMRDTTGERAARFVCAAALADSGRIVAEAVGKLEGEIGFEQRGKNGFGYDPVFRLRSPDSRHLAELTSEEKNAISHRGKALREILPDIILHLNSNG